MIVYYSMSFPHTLRDVIQNFERVGNTNLGQIFIFHVLLFFNTASLHQGIIAGHVMKERETQWTRSWERVVIDASPIACALLRHRHCRLEALSAPSSA